MLCLTEYLRKQRYLKVFGTRPVLIRGPCKVFNDILDNFLQSQPNLSGINPPTYKLGNIQVPILKSWTSNDCTVRDSFAFAEEIV